MLVVRQVGRGRGLVRDEGTRMCCKICIALLVAACIVGGCSAGYGGHLRRYSSARSSQSRRAVEEVELEPRETKQKCKTYF